MHESNFVRIVELMVEKLGEPDQKGPKKSVFNFFYYRVRLPGDIIFALWASFGSYRQWGMSEIFDNFFCVNLHFGL